MKKHQLSYFMSALLALAPAAYAGPDHIEGDNDAGSLPGSAQETMGSGTLGFIRGTLEGLNAGTGFDLEDMYVIVIDDPTCFSATTLDSMGAFANFDSRLYLFQISGLGLLGNDDTAGGGGAGAGKGGFGACCLMDGTCIESTPGNCIEAGGDYQGDETFCDDGVTCAIGGGGSTLGNTSNDGTEVVITEPGMYLLAITVTPREPLSDGGPIYFFEQSTEVSGPDGPGGEQEITNWEPLGLECGSEDAGSCFEANDTPFCNLTGCCGIVCESLPSCCEEVWGTPCASLASEVCIGGVTDSPAGSGGDLPGDYIIALTCVTFSEQTGACCLPAGTCEILTAEDCAAQDGDYQGDGTICFDPQGNPTCPQCTDDTQRTLIIKQGACPAPISAAGGGIVPMLLVGEADFAAPTADAASLELRRADGSGGVVQPSGLSRIKDLNHPYDGDGQGPCRCNADQSSDGIADLDLRFNKRELVTQLGLSPADGIVELELTGMLQDGSFFCARNCVVVIGGGPQAAR